MRKLFDPEMHAVFAEASRAASGQKSGSRRWTTRNRWPKPAPDLIPQLRLRAAGIPGTKREPMNVFTQFVYSQEGKRRSEVVTTLEIIHATVARSIRQIAPRAAAMPSNVP